MFVHCIFLLRKFLTMIAFAWRMMTDQCETSDLSISFMCSLRILLCLTHCGTTNACASHHEGYTRLFVQIVRIATHSYLVWAGDGPVQ